MVAADIGIAVFDIVGCADTAEVAGTVGLVHTVEIVDTAELAADTADIVAATEWQPYPTLVTANPRFYHLQIKEKGIRLRACRTPLKFGTSRLRIEVFGKVCFSGGKKI